MTAPQRLRTVFVCLCVSFLLVQQAGRTQSPPADALKFFKNYFGTIDYVVAGKGLEGQGGSNGLALRHDQHDRGAGGRRTAGRVPLLAGDL